MSMTNTPEHVPVADDSDIELLYSNLNSAPFMIAVGGIRAYSQLLNEIRYDEDNGYDAGLEITPTRTLVADFGFLRGRAPVVDDRPFASAVHQSWAPGPSEILRRKQTLESFRTDVGAYALMIEERRSLKTVARLSRQLGDVPAVVYPDFRGHDKLPDFKDLGMLQVESQLSPEVYRDLDGEDNFSNIRLSMETQGVHGLVIDTHHLQRAATDEPGYQLDPHKVLDEVETSGVPVTRIHVAAGREDSKDDDRRMQSRWELTALQGKHPITDTMMGEVLERSYRIWEAQRKARGVRGDEDKLPVTVEVPFAGLQMLLGHDIDREEFVEAHQTITDNLRGFFAALKRGARP